MKKKYLQYVIIRYIIEKYNMECLLHLTSIKYF